MKFDSHIKITSGAIRLLKSSCPRPNACAAPLLRETAQYVEVFTRVNSPGRPADLISMGITSITAQAGLVGWDRSWPIGCVFRSDLGADSGSIRAGIPE
jgi:hypothetical protein